LKWGNKALTGLEQGPVDIATPGSLYLKEVRLNIDCDNIK